jgi:hypothetical protein
MSLSLWPAVLTNTDSFSFSVILLAYFLIISNLSYCISWPSLSKHNADLNLEISTIYALFIFVDPGLKWNVVYIRLGVRIVTSLQPGWLTSHDTISSRDKRCLFSPMYLRSSGTYTVSYSISPHVTHPGHKVDHTLPSSHNVKNEWSNTSTLPYACKVCRGTTLLYFLC